MRDQSDHHFFAPTAIAICQCRAWTHDGKLRHASYKGLRERLMR
ncbi:ATP dependent DNA ligase [Rhizobium leguminosarum]